MNYILQTLFFKINDCQDNVVRTLKFLSKQLVCLRYFDRLFSSDCLNNDSRVRCIHSIPDRQKERAKFGS